MTRQEVEASIGVDLSTIFHQGPSGLRIPDMVCAYETACGIEPQILVEIGAGWGISSVMLGFVAKKYGGKLYSVEYRVKEAWSDYIAKYGLSDHVEMVVGRNPWLDWPSLKHITKIDYLLIDGYHDLYSVMVDFQVWAPRVRRGGRIAFHDYINGSAEVKKAVDLFEQSYGLEPVGASKSRAGLYVVTKTGIRPK